MFEIPKTNLEDKIKEIAGKSWNPVEVARVNDQVVRLALMQGEYHWHKHENADELFYVVSGELTIQLKGFDNIVLKVGEFAVVPKGIDHCPKSEIETYVLMFEPASLGSKGKLKF